MRTRNLLNLVWMGLGCQAAGVVLALAGAASLPFGKPLEGVLFLIFGMALGGWANNQREIVDLKQRLSAVELRTRAQTAPSEES